MFKNVFTVVAFCGAGLVHGKEALPGNLAAYVKENFTYKTVGTLEIKLDVYRDPKERIRPGIMYIHGGALIGGTRGFFLSYCCGDQLKKYLDAGFNVVSIDYRLAPETKLADIIRDIEDAYAWVRAKGPDLLRVDPDHIAVMGESAGGYLTLMAGFRFEPRPRALVSFYGYGDITGSWQVQPSPVYNQLPAVSREQAFKMVRGPAISEIPFGVPDDERGAFYFYCRQQGLWPKEVSGHDPAKESDWFIAYEPRRNVTPAYPPTMLLHGNKDEDVPFEQSALMAEALKTNEVDYELMSRPDWGHAFNLKKETPDTDAAIERVVAFLKKHVR